MYFYIFVYMLLSSMFFLFFFCCFFFLVVLFCFCFLFFVVCFFLFFFFFCPWCLCFCFAFYFKMHSNCINSDQYHFFMYILILFESKINKLITKMVTCIVSFLHLNKSSFMWWMTCNWLLRCIPLNTFSWQLLEIKDRQTSDRQHLTSCDLSQLSRSNCILPWKSSVNCLGSI